jgi:3-hydroxypropanoate dehydrogenase
VTTASRIIDNFRTSDEAFTPIDQQTPATSLRPVADVFREGRTAYAFTDEQVTDAELDLLGDLLRHPPTAMNTQPLRVVLVRSDEAKARLLPHLAEGNRAKAASAPVVAILAADTDFHEQLPRLMPHAPGARDRFADDTAREQAAHFNATLQAGYFILAVRAVGLDAGPMGGFSKAGIDHEFFGDGPVRSLLVVNIGHAAADGTFPRSPRLERDEVFTTV